MPSYRVTLISNANQAQKITFLLTNSSTTAILKAAKDKLRLKKPNRIFLPGGQELSNDHITDHLQNGAEFLISCGEDFIGLRKTIQNTNQCEVTVIAKQSFID